MTTASLLQALRRRKEISITVRGRRTGRKITLPVWFILEDGTMWLLPVRGSHSQWFRNAVADPTLVILAGQVRRTIETTPVRGRGRVQPVVERFREKYGRGDVRRYYARFDAAVRVPLAPVSSRGAR